MIAAVNQGSRRLTPLQRTNAPPALTRHPATCGERLAEPTAGKIQTFLLTQGDERRRCKILHQLPWGQSRTGKMRSISTPPPREQIFRILPATWDLASGAYLDHRLYERHHRWGGAIRGIWCWKRHCLDLPVSKSTDIPCFHGYSHVIRKLESVHAR